MIQLNDFTRQWTEISENAISAFRTCGESGWYILGQEVANFEKALVNVWPAQATAVGCATGMDAIEISLRTLGVQPGDRVITTPLSAFATTLAIVRLGAIPIFVDVDSRGSLDLDKVRRVLRADLSIRWMVPVHLFGIPLDLDHLDALKKDFDLNIVEDCAQAIGASYRGRLVGSVGQTSALSLYPTKNLGALGDGGALLTREDLAEKARALRDYGQSAKYVHAYIGLNSRLDEVHAAVLRHAMLPRLEKWTDRRREIARRYMSGIENPLISLPVIDKEMEPVWHLFPIMVSNQREELGNWMREQNVASGIHYPILIPDQPALKEYGRYEVVGDLENARSFAENELSIPIHPFLTDSEIDHVIKTINRWRY